MNKEKYLKELEKRLSDLTEEQKQQEIFRISNELDSGKVVNDLSTEINEIYKKYESKNFKVDRNNNFVNKLNKFSSFFDKFIKLIKKNSFKDNLIVIRDFILIILIISFLKIPFLGVENILFSLLKNIVSNNIHNIINLIIEILYVIFAVIMFIKIFKRRFLLR